MSTLTWHTCMVMVSENINTKALVYRDEFRSHSNPFPHPQPPHPKNEPKIYKQKGKKKRHYFLLFLPGKGEV